MKRIAAHDQSGTRIAEAVLFLAIALSFGLFDPKLGTPAFAWQQSTGFEATIAASSSADLINQLQWGALAALASWLIVSAPDRFVRVILSHGQSCCCSPSAF